MANLTQTAANVGLSGVSPTLISVQAGEALTQGQPVYRKSDTKYWKAGAASTSEVSVAVGICLTPAAADGYAVVATAGKIDLGATLTVGTTYVVSATLGAIAPIADLATTNYVSILGVASGTDALDLDIDATGIAKP